MKLFKKRGNNMRSNDTHVQGAFETALVSQLRSISSLHDSARRPYFSITEQMLTPNTFAGVFSAAFESPRRAGTRSKGGIM